MAFGVFIGFFLGKWFYLNISLILNIFLTLGTSSFFTDSLHKSPAVTGYMTKLFTFRGMTGRSVKCKWNIGKVQTKKMCTRQAEGDSSRKCRDNSYLITGHMDLCSRIFAAPPSRGEIHTLLKLDWPCDLLCPAECGGSDLCTLQSTLQEAGQLLPLLIWALPCDHYVVKNRRWKPTWKEKPGNLAAPPGLFHGWPSIKTNRRTTHTTHSKLYEIMHSLFWTASKATIDNWNRHNQGFCLFVWPDGFQKLIRILLDFLYIKINKHFL